MSKAAQHMRPAPEPERRPIHLQVVIVFVLSALGALFLEAGTLFGSFAYSVRDLSAWMPKRMVVFFCLLLPVNALALHAVRDIFRTRRQEGAPRVAATPLKRGALSLMAIGIVIALGIIGGRALATHLGNPQDPRYGIALAGVCATLLLLGIHFKAICRSLEWGYLILAISIGSVCCFLMPVSAEISWDGHIHFDTANALSFVYDAEYTGADAIMTMGGADGSLLVMGIQNDVEDFDVELDSRRVPFPHADLRYSSIVSGSKVLQVAEDTEPIIRKRGTETKDRRSYVAANAFGYIPNAIGLWLGRLFHMGPVGRYTLARLCNLWFYATVFFFAIRALRNGKAIMAAIGLCPTALLEAANFSYDPWSICLLSLSVGLFVGKLQQGKSLTPIDTLQCLVPFVLGACVRAILFPLALVFLLPSRKRFSSPRAWAAHIFLVLGAITMLLLSFGIPYIVGLSNGTNNGDTRGGSGVNSGGQIAYVLSHPWETLRMGVVFAARMLNPLNLGLALDPSDENLLCYFPYLISSDAPLTEILAPAEFILLTGMSFLDGGPEDEEFAESRFKLITLVALGLSFALICGALYVGFTEVGRNTIAGVQQRYLLGLLSFLCLFVPNIAFRRRGGRTWVAPVFIITEAVVLTLVLWNSFLWMF